MRAACFFQNCQIALRQTTACVLLKGLLEKHSNGTDDSIQHLPCLDAVGQNFDDKMNVSIRDKMTNLSIGQKKGDYVVSSKSLVIDAGSWNNPKFYRGKMAAAQEAIAGQLSVDITYIDRNDNLTERVLDPYTVVLKEGVWYVYGWCHQRKDFRLFRLSRIKSMFITDNVFTVKENNVFDKLHETLPKTHQIELTLSVKDEALSDVEEWLGIEAMTKSSAGAEFTALVYGGSELIKKLLSLGSNVKVLSPRAVAEELQVEVNRIVERYSL